MIYSLLSIEPSRVMVFISIILTFVVTILTIAKFKKNLPCDLGREFAVNGELSKGKPRGAGIIFILCFIMMSVLFIPLNRVPSIEYAIYCLLTLASMFSGYLDDKADKPWNEYKKGAIDLIIVLAGVVTVTLFNKDHIGFYVFSNFIELPLIVYVILAVVLLWVSINVTNCSDGVDGLCASMSIISLLTVYVVLNIVDNTYSRVVLLFVASILGYLWFNISPSKLLMGDAGSRAIGFFIGVMVLKTHHPLLFLLISFMLIIDGGLGLIKLFLLRFFKIHILKNVRTPIHDHARKTWGWSDSQVVFKFTIIQVIASLAVLYLCI